MVKIISKIIYTLFYSNIVVLNAPLVVSVEVYPKKYARVNNFLVPIFCHENSSGVRCAWYAKSEGKFLHPLTLGVNVPSTPV